MGILAKYLTKPITKKVSVINTSKYDAMEIGFPSEVVPEIISYAEDEENPTDTVYGYVPTEIIQSIIDKHGGINEAITFANKDLYFTEEY